MRAIAEKILAGFSVGLFCGVVNMGIVITPINLINTVRYGVPFVWACSGAPLFAFFGGPIGACVGMIIGAFIGMSDYVTSVKYRWGVIAALGAALGAAFIADEWVEMWLVIMLANAITGELVARCIAALFTEKINEPGTLRAWLGYISSSLLIAVAVNRYLEWWILVISEID